MTQQPIDMIHIDGLVPVIINIIPLNNLPFILGLSDEGQEAPVANDDYREDKYLDAARNRYFKKPEKPT